MYRIEIPVDPPDQFVDIIPSLYAPMRTYVMGVVPLLLEHIWQLKTNNNSSAQDELLNCAWISRLITLDKRVLDPEKQDEIIGWTEMRTDLIKNIDQCKEKKGVPFMLEECMKGIVPVLEKRFKENYHFPVRSFHCWWYTIHDDDTHLALHLINAYQPDSPFQHLNHFLTTMLQAVEHAIAAYPHIQKVSCGSWLNQVPKFQRLWPDSFQQDQKILNETGGFGPGAWGQYMTTEGGFNEAKADSLRRTGKHPFALTEAHSSLEEVTAHIKKRIAETGHE